ncbi:hypothetical protein OESDEN_16924 [Oesophagostomum dentatum]|uniref:Uncharacterized protein n=1 Tax=Oesophagostomum dentatum TaxID=61180 RepID=A0A0B1SEL5_OESDE|nr:hypothetical protein OESDEN_16924 [Oesophagostomum dentatum]
MSYVLYETKFCGANKSGKSSERLRWHGTMNRMHSRMRILTIFIPCTFFLMCTWLWAPWCSEQVEVPEGEVPVTI